MSMELTLEAVTVQKAEAWLNRNKANRVMREGVAEKYAADMRDGKWTKCPVPISFYEDGDLADGQHRLWAIVLSEKPQRFPVARGLTREDGLNLDTGLTRNVVDNARIAGKEDISTALVSAARAVAEGQYSQGSRSTSQRLQIVEQHREACGFAVSHVRRVRGLCSSMVYGAIGRAWYHEDDKERLVRFCKVFGEGFMASDDEAAAVAIRSYLLMKGTFATSQSEWRDTFLKMQNAIRFFMKRKKLTRIVTLAEEAYPLPRGMAPPAPISSKRSGAAKRLLAKRKAEQEAS